MALREKVVSTACNMKKGYEGVHGKDVVYNITIANLKEDTTAEDMVEISDAIDGLTIGDLYTCERRQSKELIG